MDTQCCTEVAGLDRTWTYLCWFSGIFGKDSLANYQELIIPATHPATQPIQQSYVRCTSEIHGIFGAQDMVQPSSALYVQMIKASGMVNCWKQGVLGEVREAEHNGFDMEHDGRNIYTYIHIHIHTYIYMMWVKYVIHQPPVIAPSHHHVYRCKNPFLV